VQTERDRDRKAIFAMCSAFGLSRADRLEVVTVLLDRNVESFACLDDNEVRRLRDAMHGAVLVCTIQRERRRGERI
jgi:hypothetical protein